MLAVVGFGNMGKAVCNLCKDGLMVVEKDEAKWSGHGCLFATSLSSLPFVPEVIIDFSSPSATQDICAYAANNTVPVVVACTGHTKGQMEGYHVLSKTVPVLISANMCFTVHSFAQACLSVGRSMPNCKIYIHETHRADKKDKPSGTAIMIAKVLQTLPWIEGWKLDGYDEDKETRTTGEPYNHSAMDLVHITCTRERNVVGIHRVTFVDKYQRVTMEHNALDRALFAQGAVMAASFLQGKPPRLYTMADMEAIK